MTDHFTRQRVNNDAPQRVLGALLGIQQGRRVEIHTSFELVYDVVDGDIVIGCLSFEGGGGEVAYLTDPKYLNQKKDQFLQVFPTYEILGWYTSGSNLVDRDQIPHKVCFVWGGNLWGFGHRARPLGISTLWESFSCTHSHIPNFQFTMPTHKYPAFP